jgi:hypothetical protein
MQISLNYAHFIECLYGCVRVRAHLCGCVCGHTYVRVHVGACVTARACMLETQVGSMLGLNWGNRQVHWRTNCIRVISEKAMQSRIHMTCVPCLCLSLLVPGIRARGGKLFLRRLSPLLRVGPDTPPQTDMNSLHLILKALHISDVYHR